MNTDMYQNILSAIKTCNSDITIMELCGSHTAAISKSGLRDSLPKNIRLIPGPGCPVCVTGGGYIDAALRLSGDNIITTFGDLVRVPGKSGENLLKNGNIKIVYSPLDAVEIARSTNSEVVFLAIGFETTAPVISVAVEKAITENVKNFSILTSMKTMPKAFRWLTENTSVTRYLLPGHVCAVSGVKDYEEIAKEKNIAGTVSGFSPVEVGMAVLGLLKTNRGTVDNFYKTVVRADGNQLAMKLIHKYFTEYDAFWRGIGYIEGSGLRLKEEYRNFDAEFKFGIKIKDSLEDADRCGCGKVLIGEMEPKGCPYFGKKCTPLTPVGPCMVSSEGACRIFMDF